MSRRDDVSRLSDDYLDRLANAAGIPLLLEDTAQERERRRRRVRRALREIAREDRARERGLDPQEAQTR